MKFQMLGINNNYCSNIIISFQSQATVLSVRTVVQLRKFRYLPHARLMEIQMAGGWQKQKFLKVSMKLKLMNFLRLENHL